MEFILNFKLLYKLKINVNYCLSLMFRVAPIFAIILQRCKYTILSFIPENRIDHRVGKMAGLSDSNIN